MFSSAKHPVLTGTAILTCAGILSRLIGFFYRIFLSRTIGAQGLGIYQMIFPVYAFCLSGVTAGIQSALSCSDTTTKSFTGTITDASMNTVTVENAEGTFTFSTMDADKSEANGLLLGAPVTVNYSGKLEEGAAASKVATDPTYAEAVGNWTMPDPIDPDGVMGIRIMVEGEAQSINMATLRYTSWELQGEAGKILLKGQSIGNGQTIDFTETATIAKDADGIYTLTIESNGAVYTKANE